MGYSFFDGFFIINKYRKMIFILYTFCKSLCVINVESTYGLHWVLSYILYLQYMIKCGWLGCFNQTSAYKYRKILTIHTNYETKWSWPPSSRYLMLQSFLFAATIVLSRWYCHSWHLKDYDGLSLQQPHTTHILGVVQARELSSKNCHVWSMYDLNEVNY